MADEIQLKDLSYQKAIAIRTPEEMIQHLNSFVPTFELKFSAGDWFAGISVPASYEGKRAGNIRFHRGYRRPMELQEKFDMYQRLNKHGLVAVEAHYHPKYGEITEENFEKWQQFHKETNLRIKPALNAHYDELSEWGGLSNPYESVRKQAVQWLKRTLEIAKMFGEDSATVWPGIEGYENPFGLNIATAKGRFTDSVAEAMDAVPGTRVSGEMKPYEPRRYILYGTSAEGLLFAYDVERKLTNEKNRELLKAGTPLVVFGPEIGHMKMADEDVAEVLQMYAAKGILNHIHWNAHTVGTLDFDFNPGTVAIENMDQGLYALMMIGYDGLQGIDIDPAYMDTERALLNSMDALRSTADRLKRIDHEKVILTTSFPADNRGTLDQLLLRNRAHPDDLKNLSPMPKWVEPKRNI